VERFVGFCSTAKTSLVRIPQSRDRRRFWAGKIGKRREKEAANNGEESGSEEKGGVGGYQRDENGRIGDGPCEYIREENEVGYDVWKDVELGSEFLDGRNNRVYCDCSYDGQQRRRVHNEDKDKAQDSHKDDRKWQKGIKKERLKRKTAGE